MFGKQGNPPVTEGAPDTSQALGMPPAVGPTVQGTTSGAPVFQLSNASFGASYGTPAQRSLFPAYGNLDLSSTPTSAPFGHQQHFVNNAGNINLFDRLGPTAAPSPPLIGGTAPAFQSQDPRQGGLGVASPAFGFGSQHESQTLKEGVSATCATPFSQGLNRTSPFGTVQTASKCSTVKEPLFGSANSPLKSFAFHARQHEPGKPSLFGNLSHQQGGFGAPLSQQIKSTMPASDTGKQQNIFAASQEVKAASLCQPSQQQQQASSAEEQAERVPDTKFFGGMRPGTEGSSLFSNKGRATKFDTGASSLFTSIEITKPSIFAMPSAGKQLFSGLPSSGDAGILQPQKSIFRNVKHTSSPSTASSGVFHIGGRMATNVQEVSTETTEAPLPPLLADERKCVQSKQASPAMEELRGKESPTDSHAVPSDGRTPEGISRRRHSLHSSRRMLSKALAGVEGERRKGSKVIATPEEISTLVTLMCTNIPAEHNDRETLLEHFSQFGPIERIICQPRKGSATVKFRDHQTAELAKKHGANLSSTCPPLEIFWCSSRKSTPEGQKQSSSSITECDQEETDITEPQILQRPEEHAAKRPSLLRRVSESARSTSLLSKLMKPRVASAKAILQRKTKPATERAIVDVPKCANQAQDEAHLLSELRQTANTVGERFRVLDARDKIIRLHLQKQSDIVTARATRGCCPDMCPEKERYSRNDKKCLSFFEFMPGTDGTMDPCRMVKEYSRSSADQEEPLPHELRPPAVLSLTMDYLMTDIMDMQENVSVGDWYDFIWNRTRAIRKDVTQQHLCDIISASLVEKCARFHIHCAAVLIEEDMSHFDSNINDENLGKCLQTLKHMYYDLSLRGVRCPNEAEFRAYDVLLHLSEGDVVWQVQQLPEDIRRSREVSLSVAASEALNCNNYVRFFRIAASAPYLSACLLHRYFAQVRTQAFQTILKACRQTSHKEEIPLSTLVDLLKFDDPAEAKDFAACLGQATDEKFLYVDRSSQIQLERAPLREGGGSVIFSARRGWEQKGRSKLLVESKRTCSIGEVVNGGPLPANPLKDYAVHDSFMGDGMLRTAAYDAGDQVKKCWGVSNTEASTHQAEPSFAVTTSPKLQPSITPPAPVYSNEVIKDVARDIINEAIVDHAYSLGQEVILTEYSERVANQLLEEVTAASARDLCQELYLATKEQRLQEILIAKQLAREQAQEAEHRCHVALTEEMTMEVVEDIINGLCRSSHREALQELWDKQAAVIQSSLLLDVVACEVQDAATSVFKMEMALYGMKLSTAQSYSNMRLLQRSFKRWLDYKAEQKSQRFARETFPSIPNMDFNLSDPELGLTPKRPRMTLKEHGHVKEHLDAAVLLKVLHDELEWAPMDISSTLKRTPGNFQFPFKLLVSLPSGKQKELEELSAKVMMKLGFARQHGLTSGEKVRTHVNSEEASMPFCITAINCSPCDLTLDHMGHPQAFLGTSAVLVIVASEHEVNVSQRLKDLLASTSKLNPVPPVCLLDVSHQKACSDVAGGVFGLDSLQQQSLVPEKLLILRSDAVEQLEFRHLIDTALEWCSTSRSNVPGLCSDYLKDFVEKAIVELVFDIIYGDIAAMQNNPQYPHLVLKLYNAAMEHLADVLASESLARLTVAPPELNVPWYGVHWNDPMYLLCLRDVVLSLRLPLISGDPHEVDAVWEYVQQLCKMTECQHSATVLMPSTREALKSRGIINRKPLPWASIIHDCHCHILQSANFFDTSTGKEYIAHYNEDELYSFKVPQFWNGALHWASPVRKSTPSVSVSGGESEPMQEMNDSDSDRIGTDSDILDQIDTLLQRQKAESRSFTAHLEELVYKNPLDGIYQDFMVSNETSWNSCDDGRSGGGSLLNLADAVDALNTRVRTNKISNQSMQKMLELVLN